MTPNHKTRDIVRKGEFALHNFQVIFLVAFSDLLNLEPMNDNIDSVCVLHSWKLYPLIAYEAA